jgi:hypothetical protein
VDIGVLALSKRTQLSVRGFDKHVEGHALVAKTPKGYLPWCKEKHAQVSRKRKYTILCYIHYKVQDGPCRAPYQNLLNNLAAQGIA